MKKHKKRKKRLKKRKKYTPRLKKCYNCGEDHRRKNNRFCSRKCENWFNTYILKKTPQKSKKNEDKSQ